MGYVYCPYYQIHATNDKIIPFEHAKILLAAAPKNFDCFFPEEGDHDEIKQINHVEYYQRLKLFLQYVH